MLTGAATAAVNNYAHLLAERLHLNVSDVSCGGVTTANISAWNEFPARSKQLRRTLAYRLAALPPWPPGR